MGELKVNREVYIHPLSDLRDSRDSKPVDTGIIGHLQVELSKVFREVIVLEGQEVPDSAFNHSRKQFNSKKVLEVVELVGDINLGVLEGDLYSHGFNFIFGEAELGRNKAVISIHRLRPRFYGEDEDRDLLKLRTLKEAVHEIGHMLGLRHCPDDRCVMYFSHNIKETDLKDWRYCKRCWSQL